MKCHKCGTEIGNDARFCKSCGQKLLLKKGSDFEVFSVEKSSNSDKLVFDDPLISDRFKIIKKIGAGGMGEIFHAKDLRLKREVAIKSISEGVLVDFNSKARFLREAQTASQLEHSNICTIYEIYEEENNNYIVMQYIDGVTLDHIIKLKKLSINKVLNIGIQICEGMIEAHSKEIIHRDIKPGNIMINKKGMVKILDFGLAKFRDESLMTKKDFIDSANLTEKGIVMGTVSYMSPEQAKGQNLESRSDIFSFGVVLYEMLEGINPFQDKDHISTLYNVIHKKVKFFHDIPAGLKKIVLKAMEKNAEKRYPDFESLKIELEKFQQKYHQTKDLETENNKTEIIDSSDREKWIKEIKKTSDKEGLGEIVNRIKKLKARTEPMISTKSWKLKIIAVPLLIILAVTLYLILSRNKKVLPADLSEKFYIYLHDFENKTNEDDLSEKLNYLLTQSLNQFQEFKTINRKIAYSISRVSDSNLTLSSFSATGGKDVSLKKNQEKSPLIYNQVQNQILNNLLQKFKVLFELKGTITKFNNFYNIDAVLIPVDRTKKSFPITIPLDNKNTLLSHQVDTLTKRVFLSIFSEKNESDFELKKTSKIYGNDWKVFSSFFQGFLFYKKLNTSQAEYYLNKSSRLLISKYLLADIYYFKGDREKSIQFINEILPQLAELTKSTQLRVMALKARLNFNFTNEIKNLEKLKNEFSFLKETFYELGEAYFHHGNARKAILYYQQALQIKQSYSKAINHMGYCFSYLGDHNKAIQLFEDYRNLDQSANSFDSLGDGYFYAGDLKSAENLKLAAVSKDCYSVPWSYLSLADIYIQRAEYEKATGFIENYRKIVQSKKEIARSFAKEAYIGWLEKKYDNALSLLEKSTEIYNSNDINDYTVAEAHWLRGIVLLAQNRLAESKLELEWLLKIKIKYRLSEQNFFVPYKYIRHLQALIQEKEGNLENSEEHYRSLIRMKTQLSYWVTLYHYQFYHTQYVKFLFRHQRWQDALREVDLCLEYNQSYIPALWEKARILEKLEKFKEMTTIYQKINELYGKSNERNLKRNLLQKKLKKNI